METCGSKEFMFKDHISMVWWQIKYQIQTDTIFDENYTKLHQSDSLVFEPPKPASEMTLQSVYCQRFNQKAPLLMKSNCSFEGFKSASTQ